ncbi:Putative uncharacterized protein [Lactococcus lactis subsp. lactis A12]|uniref:Uncharacterized protein n=1 Tax=Lactococcus lactis subsp. lactis A12 TaxID=1137134 RepID=S6FIE4_LACLL|nr:Putative uncharacterized protein [Lactococcus lactis subsp. lactis A12]
MESQTINSPEPDRPQIINVIRAAFRFYHLL